MSLEYDKGTLLLKGVGAAPRVFTFDPRAMAWRCLAQHYVEALRALRSMNVEFEDRVLNLVKGRLEVREEVKLRPYQREALEAWLKRGRRGVVVLPTGAGKTHVGLAAIVEVAQPTLIVVPTLELMDQWEALIKRHFKVDVGRVGGGVKELGFITVSTYDSAHLNAELLGNRFALLVFDEVHHLPAPSYRQIAELNAAPYRLGLTATPERTDLLHEDLVDLVGPVVYRKGPEELRGSYLADFEVVTIKVPLSEEERRRYVELKNRYRSFLAKHGLRFRGVKDFSKLVLMTSRDKEAWEALTAWREMRRIAFNASRKLEVIKELLAKHRGDKVIIFSDDVDFVRRLSVELLIPEVTYKTGSEERRAVMDMFRRGEVKVIATSRALEEGIDVPDARVAIVVSGTATRRQFLQRLGRVLRPKEGEAVLYELVTRGTVEVDVARRRKS
ncbi:MAG: ATP-dependent helicase [Thermoprotei archaeon]|nr:MAG: ATP-dependent helicase [Thermoprotei archaeon]